MKKCVENFFHTLLSQKNVCGKIFPHTQKSLFWTVLIKQGPPFWFLSYLVLRRRRNSFWKYFVSVSQNCLCAVKFYRTPKSWFAGKRKKMSIAPPAQKLLRIVFRTYMCFPDSEIQKKCFRGDQNRWHIQIFVFVR